MRTLENHKNNNNKSYVYRTQSDPVSIGTHLNHDNNRKIITVSQKSSVDSHSIDNFYKTKHTRTLEDINNDVSHEMLKMFGIGAKSVIKEELGEEIDLFNSINPMTSEASGMSDEEAKAIGLDKLADLFKSNERRQEDKLMELAESQTKSDDIIKDIDGDIVSKSGVRYVQVSGENYNP
eukprot:4272866-Pyramimonas_sp.AAC.1